MILNVKMIRYHQLIHTFTYVRIRIDRLIQIIPIERFINSIN